MLTPCRPATPAAGAARFRSPERGSHNPCLRARSWSLGLHGNCTPCRHASHPPRARSLPNRTACSRAQRCHVDEHVEDTTPSAQTHLASRTSVDCPGQARFSGVLTLSIAVGSPSSVCLRPRTGLSIMPSSIPVQYHRRTSSRQETEAGRRCRRWLRTRAAVLGARLARAHASEQRLAERRQPDVLITGRTNSETVALCLLIQRSWSY